MEAEERQPVSTSWADILGQQEERTLTDAEAIEAYETRAAIVTRSNGFFATNEECEALATAAYRVEALLRRAVCSSNVVAAIKLLLVEEGMKNGETEDDRRLHRSVIYFLAGDR